MKFEINIMLVDYIQCIKYSISKISLEFQDVKVHQTYEAKIKLS